MIRWHLVGIVVVSVLLAGSGTVSGNGTDAVEMVAELDEDELVGTWTEIPGSYRGDPGVDWIPLVFRFDDDNNFVFEQPDEYEKRRLTVRGKWQLDGATLRFSRIVAEAGTRRFPDYLNLTTTGTAKAVEFLVMRSGHGQRLRTGAVVWHFIRETARR